MMNPVLEVLVWSISLAAVMATCFFLGKKVGWHSACSECLDAYASALKTINAGLCFFRPKEGEPYPNPSRVLGSISSEYQEELRGRGIWKDGWTTPDEALAMLNQEEDEP